MKVVTGDQQFFKSIKKVKFEGKDSDNPIAFKYYNPQQKVGKKTMESHLRFAVAYWHILRNRCRSFRSANKNFPMAQSNRPCSACT